ncbi:hypothetical protein BDY24DRAFT_60980 [Mrakia frigida]|uniref:uncharacterized protein n=1 Tax=Mrakia frigida TaxID=29902 RepID=UPI003FCBF65B
MAEIAPPRRRLPWDVLLLVFKEADPSTLAVLGRVSYDFLAATSLGLYRDVVVTSAKQLRGLFCIRWQQHERKTKTSSRIDSFLSLSQIKILSLLPFESYSFSTLDLWSSRMEGSVPIPLNDIRISVQYSYQSHLHLQNLHTCLLPLLNPARCFYDTHGRREQEGPWTNIGSSNLTGWTRLQHLEIRGSLPYSSLETGAFVGALPSPSINQRRTIRLHLSSLLCRLKPTLEDFLDTYLLGRDSQYGLDTLQVGSLVLVVPKHKKEEVEEAVRVEEKFRRWRRVLVVAAEE